MTAILTDLEPLEVSLVDRAANKRSFLIMKSENGISEENQKDQSNQSQQDQSSSENVEKNSDTQSDSTTTTENESFSDQSTENQEDGSQTQSEDQTAEGAEGSTDVEKSANDSSQILKSESGDISVDLNLLPENLRWQVETLFKSREDEIKKAAHFESLFKKQLEERETKEFVEKAASFKNLPIKTESLGAILKSAFHAMPKEHYDELEKVLKSANDKMEAFFKEAGQSSGSTETVGDANEQLNAIAQQISKSENVSFAQGFKLAVDRNPQLYKETRKK